jgi:PPOX class probable F420-dependent enzyme
MANVAAEPRVTLLADAYDDADWSALWWVRADGRARVLGDAQADEVRRAIALLAGRYSQYRDTPPAGPVLAVDVERWSGWSAS